MTEPMRHKISEAVPTPQQPDASGKPEPGHDEIAAQERRAQKGHDAANAQGDREDKLVEIGKANHMGGRSPGRVSDQG